MEKEDRRYYLISYCGTNETVVKTNAEYKALLKKVKDYTDNPKSKYLFGNVTKEICPEGILVRAHKYRKLNIHKKMDSKSKLGPAATITELQEFTTRYTKAQLAELFRGETGIDEDVFIPDINIAYKNDVQSNRKKDKDAVHYARRISYLPVMYIQDRDNFSIEYILRKRLQYHVYFRDFGVLKDLCNALCYNKDSLPELERVRIAIDMCQNQNHSLDELYSAAEELIKKYTSQINKDDGTVIYGKDGKPVRSNRRMYDVAAFFKYCGAMHMKHSPYEYNEDYTEEKKKQLRKEEEEKKVMELIRAGKYKYEQMSLF